MQLGYGLVQALAIVAIVGSLFSAEAPTGVPRLDPDYTTTVDRWWAAHPFNPESPKYQPEIRSPSPVLELKPGDSIQDAIDALPAAGGTLKLAKGTSSQFQIVGRSHMHIRGNVIQSGPQLLKEVTLPPPDFRKEGVRTATFDGPNVLENNTVAGKNVAKGDCP